MRRPLAGTALLALVVLSIPGVPGALADPTDPDPPTRSDVREAREAAREAGDQVAALQARLDAANAELEAASVAAQQAAEAFNGARWRAQEARRAERQAARESRAAQRALVEQKERYRDTVITSFTSGEELTGFDAMLDADGLSSLLDRTVAVERVQGAFDEQRTEYLAVAEEAEEAEQAAEAAAEDAELAAEEARAARDQARAAVANAAVTAESIAAEKTDLINRLARLKDISVELAEERQAAREQRQLARQAQQAEPSAPADEPSATPEPSPSPEPSPTPQPSPTPVPQPDPAPQPPPADQGGATAAIAFARAQLGEPYRWGAAGPDSWDCSGLTMGAWAAGGKSLPHYSVAQYEQSTPIAASALQPGDLVFWGSSSSPSSIYHVALYVGGGQIIHAPRTGRPVSQESMYYWIPPNFYARP